MKILGKITKWVLTIAVLIILPVVVFTLITSRTNLISGIQSFVVLTGSMQPAIPAGSIIYTVKQPWYSEGTVIAFKSGDKTITHRVFKVVNKNNILHYETRGDANNTNDEKIITNDDILGKQVVHVPYFGRLVSFLKTPQGFFPFVIFPFFVFIVLELWNLKREIEKEIEKKIQSRLMINE